MCGVEERPDHETQHKLPVLADGHLSWPGRQGRALVLRDLLPLLAGQAGWDFLRQASKQPRRALRQPGGEGRGAAGAAGLCTRHRLPATVAAWAVVRWEACLGRVWAPTASAARWTASQLALARCRWAEDSTHPRIKAALARGCSAQNRQLSDVLGLRGGGRRGCGV